MLVMQFKALIADCFREALDRKLFWLMIIISAFIAIAMACIGLDESGISIMFGKWTFDSEAFAPGNPEGRALVGSILTKYIASLYIAWIGIIIALVATAGIFPSFLERGAVDVVLAKPMSRPLLFLGKYLGAMVFVTLQAAVFVVLTFLVVGLRWGYWIWPYLWCIPLIVVLFSYIYAFSALFGVLTRNSMAALLLSMLAWIGIYVPQAVHETLVSLPAMGAEVDQKWIRGAATVKWLVPKTRDIPHIAGNLIGASTASEVFIVSVDPPESEDDGDAADADNDSPQQGPDHAAASPSRAGPIETDMQKSIEIEKEIANVSIIKSIGSSLLFEAVIISIAIWRFCRRDF